MFHAHMVMWKILRWIFTLPQIQHGATLIFFSYHVYLFSIEASEFRNNLQFWKYILSYSSSPQKENRVPTITVFVYTKNTEFQIDKQQRQGRAFVLLCSLTYC